MEVEGDSEVAVEGAPVGKRGHVLECTPHHIGHGAHPIATRVGRGGPARTIVDGVYGATPETTQARAVSEIEPSAAIGRRARMLSRKESRCSPGSDIV